MRSELGWVQRIGGASDARDFERHGDIHIQNWVLNLTREREHGEQDLDDLQVFTPPHDTPSKTAYELISVPENVANLSTPMVAAEDNLVDERGRVMADETRAQHSMLPVLEMMDGMEVFRDQIIGCIQTLSAFMKDEGLRVIAAVGGAEWKKHVCRITELLQHEPGWYRLFAWVPDITNVPIPYYDKVHPPAVRMHPQWLTGMRCCGAERLKEYGIIRGRSCSVVLLAPTTRSLPLSKSCFTASLGR